MAKNINRPAGGAQGGMIQQLQHLQQQMTEAQERLAQETVTATSGGNAVRVTMSGDQKCQSVVIDPELLKNVECEMLQDLIMVAVNMALDQSRELQRKVLGPLAGGLSF